VFPVLFYRYKIRFDQCVKKQSYRNHATDMDRIKKNFSKLRSWYQIIDIKQDKIEKSMFNRIKKSKINSKMPFIQKIKSDYPINDNACENDQRSFDTETLKLLIVFDIILITRKP